MICKRCGNDSWREKLGGYVCNGCDLFEHRATLSEDILRNTAEAEKAIDELRADWQCKWGLIHSNPVGPDKNPSTLNGVLVTGITVAMLLSAQKRELLILTEKISDFILECQQAIIMCHQDKYPLICRTPENQDQQGPDDYKGYVAMRTLLNETSQLQDLADLGAKTSSNRHRPWLPKLGRWVNNSTQKDRLYTKLPDNASFLDKLKNLPFAPWGYKPWVGPWHGRFPALTWQIEAGAKNRPAWWKMLWAFLSLAEQALLGNAKKPDRWSMDWTIIVVNRHCLEKSSMVSWISDRWFKKLHKLYPRGIKDVWAAYTIQHPQGHPLSRFFIE
jgi:hypothetical protein